MNFTINCYLFSKHLMDGLPLELVVGDSNMINLDWIEATLRNLEDLLPPNQSKLCIFVLSIMGVPACRAAANRLFVPRAHSQRHTFASLDNRNGRVAHLVTFSNTFSWFGCASARLTSPSTSRR